MDYYLFRILDGASLLDIQQELQRKGLKDLFIIEDDSSGEIFIGGHSRKQIKSEKALLVERKKAEVNWKEQWALFAENFKEGKSHIQLADKTLLLTPGPGFGDLSHPTTYLMLDMVKKEVFGESVIDIGTGSGILALAALLLGAKSAVGIDIDEAALEHAKENAKLNQLQAHFTNVLPKTLPEKSIFLMNMIFPEQEEFAPQKFNPLAKKWIVSGILESEKRKYLIQTRKWGWKLLEESLRLEWCGFIFEVE